MKLECCYISSNCNQVPSAADWGHNNLICYASCNAILIYAIDYGSGGKIIHTLLEHMKRVNSVKWIKGNNIKNEVELISGSSDGLAIVWTLNNDKYIPNILNGHKSNVNIVDGMYKNEDKSHTYVVTASMDSSIKIWFRNNFHDKFELLQNIEYDYNIAVSLKISHFFENSLILACGLDNSKIQIFTQNSENIFEKSALILGHDDWVRGLDFTTNNDILLASCSQDNLIRLWRISSENIVSDTKFKIKTSTRSYHIYLESLLTGHEGFVYSVNWSQDGNQLLSASLDKSMIIWEYDKSTNLWLEKVRVGEVGGNTLGFYGGLFGPRDHILAYSYHGAFHIWQKNDSDEWKPKVTLGGHFNEVTDLSWEPNGEFLVSVSNDQTTRIHAPFTKNNLPTTWHEISRPQVHGYDLSSLSILSRYKFVSGAEEKVIRVFEAPELFIDNFERICGISDQNKANHNAPKGASVPSLGLSNKAVFSDDNSSEIAPIDNKNPYPEESHFVATFMTEPPTEETLLQNTLWPEIQKLYGHGYEIMSLAASPDGKILASSCKSSKVEHAAILLWNTDTWEQTQKLPSHTLTVVQMEFSPNGQNLLSVSRDRRWSIFSKNDQNGQFELKATTDKKSAIHSRIIWTCSWSHDSKYFVTGSRDGKAVVWWENDDKNPENSIGKYEAASDFLELKNESITAVSFAKKLVDNGYLVAVGTESGFINVYTWNTDGWKRVLNLDKSVAHHLTVKKLSFRPLNYTKYNKGDKVIQLASCSSDFSVKIYDIHLT